MTETLGNKTEIILKNMNKVNKRAILFMIDNNERKLEV